MLHARLPQSAHLAFVDCGIRVALQLQHTAFTHPPVDTATRVALRASRVEVNRYAGNHIIFSFNVGNNRFLAVLDGSIAAT